MWRRAGWGANRCEDSTVTRDRETQAVTPDRAKRLDIVLHSDYSPGRGTLIEAYWEIWRSVRIFMPIWRGLVALICTPIFLTSLWCGINRPCADRENLGVGLVVPPAKVLLGLLLSRFGSLLIFQERKPLLSDLNELSWPEGGSSDAGKKLGITTGCVPPVGVTAGESEANGICFFFAPVLLCLLPFSTGAPCTDLQAMF